MIISGDTEGETLTLRVSHPDGLGDGLSRQVVFADNACLGRLREPLVIDDQPDGVAMPLFAPDSDLKVYALTGMLLYQGNAANFDPRRLPVTDVLMILETTADGKMRVYKVKSEQ